LRFLENKSFSRLGSSNEIELDIQILSATNKNLEQEVQMADSEKTFISG